jgi:hypothetical protein
MGVVPLGRNRKRLYDLRMEAKNNDSVHGRTGDDSGIFFDGRADDVTGEHRDHVRRVVAVAARLLKSENKKPEIIFAISGF